MAVRKRLIRVPQDRERSAALRMTGRYLVTVHGGAHREISDRLQRRGFAAANPVAARSSTANALPRGMHLMLPHVGVAIVDPHLEQEEALHLCASEEDAIIAVEPERIVHAAGIEDMSEYLRGWRDAVDALTDRLLSDSHQPSSLAADNTTATWGILATKAMKSRFTGLGIKLALLDSGLDITHPDFQGRDTVNANFVGDNAPFRGVLGHGTHCAGIAAGPLHPEKGPRYGVAYKCSIYAGRVADDQGNVGQGTIVQGIDWAIGEGCHVISISYEDAWSIGDPPFNTAYESAAQRALDAGCLIVAAAGNDMQKPGFVGAVGTPGNSPSVLTVAAVDRTFSTALFSNRVETDAPSVKGPDIAGPGVEIYSSWAVSRGEGEYHFLSGTSKATPYVAGIAALYAEANPGVRGRALKELIISKCIALSSGSARRGEVGHGLVQAP